MRSLERNKRDIWYRLFSDKIPVKDEYGNETGTYDTGYLNPVKVKIRVSPNKGTSIEVTFGIMTDYDRVLIGTEKLILTETSVCYIDVVPVLKEDGSTDTPHDYKVIKMAEDINVCQYAIKKI
jgi:hypothetical protein